MSPKFQRPTSAADIWGIDDLQTKDVRVPEWRMVITIRGLTAGERDSFETSLFDGSKKRQISNAENIRAKLVVRCAVNSEGNRLFSDDDVVKLAKKSGAAVDRLFDVAQELSGLTNRDVKELEKNLESDPSGDLHSS